jgi:alpha-tubulin suppressor-like RCC1 family protein
MDFTSNSSRRRRRTSSVLLLETSLSHIFNRKNKQFRTIPPRTTRLLSWNAGGVTYAASAGWATKRPASLVTHLDGSPISNVKSLSVGFYHACAVVESGEMYCWGSNRWGQIGDDGGGGVGALAVSPTAVPRPGGTPVSTHKSVHCGQYHTCAVLNDDTVWCWGFNGDGQLGVSNTANTNALTVPVANLEDVQIQSLSVGIAHACALLKNATLRCWGENSHGSLGVGDITDRLIPVTSPGSATRGACVAV